MYMQNIFKGQEKQISIVFLSDFNPAMFHPAWFEKNEILTKEQSEIAQNQTGGFQMIVTSQFTFFKTDDITVKVEPKRMDIVSSNGVLTALKDFAIKTMQLLNSFTIKAYGFNFSAHYYIESMSDYQKLGDILAPKDHWKTFLGDEVSGDNRKSGLIQLKMIKMKDNNKGSMTFDFEPSVKVKPGVYLYFNDHFNLDDGEKNFDFVSRQITNDFEKRISEIEEMQIDLLKGILNGRD